MKKGDFLIIAVVIALLIAWFVLPEKGERAVIYVDGELYREVSLSDDVEIEVESEYGKNTVVIKGGAVSIENSDCPGKDCEYGSVKESGRSLVCLPNRLTVVIEGGNTKDGTDVVL